MAIKSKSVLGTRIDALIPDPSCLSVSPFLGLGLLSGEVGFLVKIQVLLCFGFGGGTVQQ